MRNVKWDFTRLCKALVILVVLSLTGFTGIAEIAYADSKPDWVPETMTVSLWQDGIYVRVDCTNIEWDSTGVQALLWYWYRYYERYTHDTHDVTTGYKLSAENWYSTNFPNPVFDRDDDDPADGKYEEAEITMNAIPSAGTEYYAKYKYKAVYLGDFTARIQISSQMSKWFIEWQTVENYIHGTYSMWFNHPYALLSTRTDNVLTNQVSYNSSEPASEHLLEQKTFGSYIKYKVIEISNSTWKHAEVDAIHMISSVDDFMAYSASMSNYLSMLDYFFALNVLDANAIDVVITFRRPIGLAEYRRLLELGVNITSFECRAVDSLENKYTIGGSPEYMDEILTPEEIFQEINSFAAEDSLTPIGITGMEAKVSRDLIDILGNESFVLLVDITPAILKACVAINYNVYDVDVNLNDLYWTAEGLEII